MFCNLTINFTIELIDASYPSQYLNSIGAVSLMKSVKKGKMLRTIGDRVTVSICIISLL